MEKNDLDFERWADKVFHLSVIHEAFEVACEKKLLNKKEQKILKDRLNEQWSILGDLYPHPNPHLIDAFKKNFRNL